MRNTEMICKNCLYRVKSTRGHICEKTGKHLYWKQQTCPDHIENASSYWKDQKKENKFK